MFKPELIRYTIKYSAAVLNYAIDNELLAFEQLFQAALGHNKGLIQKVLDNVELESFGGAVTLDCAEKTKQIKYLINTADKLKTDFWLDEITPKSDYMFFALLAGERGDLVRKYLSANEFDVDRIFSCINERLAFTTMGDNPDFADIIMEYPQFEPHYSKILTMLFRMKNKNTLARWYEYYQVKGMIEERVNRLHYIQITRVEDLAYARFISKLRTQKIHCYFNIQSYIEFEDIMDFIYDFNYSEYEMQCILFVNGYVEQLQKLPVNNYTRGRRV